MDLILYFFDILINLDKHLDIIIRTYGVWSYAILIVIIFCETGLVVTPFLPGDSLLFAVGTFAALGSFQVEWIALALGGAAVAGDTTNYWIGRFTGPKVFHKERSRFFNRQYLDRTHSFYERHGAKTVSIARFVPIVRTFAPFVAGIGHMPYRRFIVYSLAGTAAWISTFVFGGYFFGNIPVVRANFTLVVMGIILVSVMPGIVEYIRHNIERKGRPG
ncbi:MAG: DedA family protein [Syntrophales bacterium]